MDILLHRPKKPTWPPRLSGRCRRPRRSQDERRPPVAGRRALTAIDLCRLANDTRDLLGHDLKRAEVELEIICSDAVPLIKGDPVALQQAFVNLVSNAADALRDQPEPRS